MIFSASPWLFLLILLAGLWLTHRVYFGPAGSRLPVSSRWKVRLAALSAAAWIALAWFVVQPLWKLNPEIYHRPVVVLAVDESPSYAWTGARTAAIPGLAEAREHYESLGFRVHVLAFGENLGENGTRVASLRHALDSLSLPNLQAVLLWSDGRFFEAADEEAVSGNWSAPVFPVRVPTVSGEVQGEGATLAFLPGHPEQGAEIRITWRAIGNNEDATAELRTAGKTVWTQKLRVPPGNASGTRVTLVFPLPAGLSARVHESARARPEAWTLLVKPASSKGEDARLTDKNDTVAIRFKGFRRTREIFLRPLVSLEERGLVDALSATDSAEVVAVFPAALKPAPGDVVWINAARASKRISAGEVASVGYRLPEDAAGEIFDGEARVSWRADGNAFLPAQVLRLADLGVDRMRLKAPEAGLEALAWAEKDGRKGLLVWRRSEAGARASAAWGMMSPPLWRTGFRAAGSGVEAQAQWVRGVSAWARARNGAKPLSPERVRDPRDVEMSLLGIDEETLTRMAVASGGKTLPEGVEKNLWPELPSGQTRENRFRALSLAPSWPAVLLIMLLLCALWTLRKRLQLD